MNFFLFISFIISFGCLRITKASNESLAEDGQPRRLTEECPCSHMQNRKMDTHLGSLYNCTCIFNAFPASGDFCSLLLTFVNSLVPDQDRQNVGPDLDSNRLTL